MLTIFVQNFIHRNALPTVLISCLLAACLALTGCQTNSDYKVQWDQPAAQQAPRTLDKSSVQNQRPDQYPGSAHVDHDLTPLPGYGDDIVVYPDGTQPGSVDPYSEDFQVTQENLAQNHGQVQSTPDYSAPQNMSLTKIAILLPMSGQHSNLGTGMLQSAQLALFELGNDKIQLIPRDTMGTAAGARQAATEAINEGADIILGPVFSHSVRAVKPIAKRANIHVLSFSTDWTLSGDNTFIMGFLPFGQVRRVAEYAHKQGYQNVGILAPNNEYGNAVISAYNAVAYRHQMPSAHAVRFPVGQSDISNVVREFSQYDDRVELLNQQIRPLKSHLQMNPNDQRAAQELAALEAMDTFGEPPYDAVLLAVGGETVRSIANLLSFYDLPPSKVKRLGTGLWDDEGLASEPALRNGWFATSAASSRTEFERKYNNLYGEHPPRLATLSYDATALSIILANNSLYQYGEVMFRRDDILNPNGFAGVDGIFRFRRDGTIERGLSIMEIGHGASYIVDPAPNTFEAIRNY